MTETITIQVAGPGRRRRFTPEQKRAFLDEAPRTGGSISEVHAAIASRPACFRWKRAMDNAKKGLEVEREGRARERGETAQGAHPRARASIGRKDHAARNLEEAIRIARIAPASERVVVHSASIPNRLQARRQRGFASKTGRDLISRG